MPAAVVDADAPELLARVRAWANGSQRVLLGVTGVPGAGKSTVAAALAAAAGPGAVVVGMDGFHLSNRVLAALGRAGCKGAPDTFDSDGYVELLCRLRADTGAVVYAPVFHRDQEEPVAADLAVTPAHRLVITEGNYLLHWPRVRPLLDACWYVEPRDDQVRLQRLIARHVTHGKPPEDAERWAMGSDEVNARLVRATRARADLVIVGG